MKLLPALVLAITAAVSGAAGASYASDQDRRDQNRDEALSKWRAAHADMASSSESMPQHSTTLREKTHDSASSVRHFTHRQAEKMRRFSERQDHKFGKSHAAVNTSPEGGGGN